MANEKFDVGKLIRGFNPLSGERLGKLIYYLVIIIISLFIFWKLFVVPTNKSTQKAQVINNITEIKNEPAFQLNFIPPSIKIGGFKIGLFKEK